LKDIKELDQREAYEYLSIEESHDLEHKNKKETFGTELCAKTKFQATGSLAVPVLRYSFGKINWRQEEL